MEQVSLKQGVKLAGVSRSTLNSHFKDGRLSKDIDMDGRSCVETSELQRVYCALSHGKTPRDVPVIHHGAPNDTPRFMALEV